MFAVEIYAAVRKFDFIEGNSRREAAREVKNLPPLAIQMRHLSFCVSGTSRNPLR